MKLYEIEINLMTLEVTLRFELNGCTTTQEGDINLVMFALRNDKSWTLTVKENKAYYNWM